jgi:hypothetical protein
LSRLRLASELFGVAFYLAAHAPIVFVYAMGSPEYFREAAVVLYSAAIVAGYVVMLGVAVFQPGPLRTLRRRQVLDRWLITFLPAFALALAMVLLKWPLRSAGWNGHGMGADGGEANALFLPWLHAGLLVVSGGLFRKAAPR